MDELFVLQDKFEHIKADWPDSSLIAKQNYVLDLDDLEARVVSIQSIAATKVLHDVCHLREHIEGNILPAQRKRNVDSLRDQEKLPGEHL